MCKDILPEKSVKSGLAPNLDGMTIVGNVFGANDGVVVPAPTSEEWVECEGKKLGVHTSGYIVSVAEVKDPL